MVGYKTAKVVNSAVWLCLLFLGILYIMAAPAVGGDAMLGRIITGIVLIVSSITFFVLLQIYIDKKRYKMDKEATHPPKTGEGDNIITVTCPDCGTEMKIEGGKKEVICEKCGKTLVLGDPSIKW